MIDIVSQILEEKEDGLYKNEKKLVNFIPRLIAIKETISKKERRISYDIEIFRDGKRVDCINSQYLYIKDWFQFSRYCPSASLSEKDRKLIQQYLEEQATQAPICMEHVFDTYGWWFDENQIAYYGKNLITYNFKSPISLKNKYCKIISANEFSLNASYISDVLQNISACAPGISWILFIASFFGGLKKLFVEAGFPIEFVINVYGKSGLGKTSLVKTICNPTKIFSFRGDKRRDVILRELKLYAGHNVLIDDFHPAESNSDSERQCSLKDSIVRLIEENQDTPSIFITSEYRDGYTSLQDREIQICLEEKINFETMKVLEQNLIVLDEIRTGFYVQVIKNVKSVIADIEYYCANEDRKDSVHSIEFRSNRYVNYIACVNMLFQKYFVDAYGIKAPKYNIEEELRSHLQFQLHHMKKIRRQEQKGTYLLAVQEMLQSNVLMHVNDQAKYDFSSNSYYLSSDQEIWITPMALRYGMMKFQGAYTFPIKSIVNELYEAGVLVTYERGNERTKKHAGVRYYEINGNILEECCSLFD